MNDEAITCGETFGGMNDAETARFPMFLSGVCQAPRRRFDGAAGSLALAVRQRCG